MVIMNIIFYRFGSKIEGPSSASVRIQRRARAVRPTTLSPRPAQASPSLKTSSCAKKPTGVNAS